MTIILLELGESYCVLAGNWPDQPPNPKVYKRMHAAEKSDTGILPKKEPNKTCSGQVAEGLEGRLVAEGNF